MSHTVTSVTVEMRKILMLTACDSQAVTMATLRPAHGDPLYFLKVANKNNVCFSPHGKDPESVCVTWPALTFIYTHTHIPVHHLCLTCTHTFSLRTSVETLTHELSHFIFPCLTSIIWLPVLTLPDSFKLLRAAFTLKHGFIGWATHPVSSAHCNLHANAQPWRAHSTFQGSPLYSGSSNTTAPSLSFSGSDDFTAGL